MNDYFLPIQENGKINSIFFKANSALIRKHKDTLLSLNSDVDRASLLENLWKKEYRGNVVKFDSFDVLTTEKWKSIQFSNKMDHMMFMLKWG
jgi:hypothetical protein